MRGGGRLRLDSATASLSVLFFSSARAAFAALAGIAALARLATGASSATGAGGAFAVFGHLELLFCRGVLDNRAADQIIERSG